METDSTTLQSAQSATGRDRLSTVLRRSGELVTVDDAAEALGVERTVAAKTLARWNRQGWLKRLRRGLYAPVPLAASSTDHAIEDIWTVVPQIFDPAYVGGLSAAHHWDLTEQLFRTVNEAAHHRSDARARHEQATLPARSMPRPRCSTPRRMNASRFFLLARPGAGSWSRTISGA